MESGEDRNLTIRIADSDGWVVAKKPLVESEEDSRRLREARQGGKRQGSNVRERQEYHGTVSEGSGSRDHDIFLFSGQISVTLQHVRRRYKQNDREQERVSVAVNWGT